MLRPASSVKPAWIIAARRASGAGVGVPACLGQRHSAHGAVPRTLLPIASMVVERAGGYRRSLHVIGADIIVSDGLARAAANRARTFQGGSVFRPGAGVRRHDAPPTLASAPCGPVTMSTASRQEIQLPGQGGFDNLALGIAILGEDGRCDPGPMSVPSSYSEKEGASVWSGRDYSVMAISEERKPSRYDQEGARPSRMEAAQLASSQYRYRDQAR